MASDGDAAAPLLTPSGDNDDEPRRRRNMFAFGCATLASMTTILMGYSTCTHRVLGNTSMEVVRSCCVCLQISR
jgi:small neutral amino acid transporter SnatA (MarC family)